MLSVTNTDRSKEEGLGLGWYWVGNSKDEGKLKRPNERNYCAGMAITFSVNCKKIFIGDQPGMAFWVGIPNPRWLVFTG
jgi:hypothetical protein